MQAIDNNQILTLQTFVSDTVAVVLLLLSLAQRTNDDFLTRVNKVERLHQIIIYLVPIILKIYDTDYKARTYMCIGNYFFHFIPFKCVFLSIHLCERCRQKDFLLILLIINLHLCLKTWCDLKWEVTKIKGNSYFLTLLTSIP